MSRVRQHRADRVHQGATPGMSSRGQSTVVAGMGCCAALLGTLIIFVVLGVFVLQPLFPRGEFSPLPEILVAVALELVFLVLLSYALRGLRRGADVLSALRNRFRSGRRSRSNHDDPPTPNGMS